MRYLLFLLLFQCVFFGAVAGDEQLLRLDVAEPEAGKEIRFTYGGPAAKLLVSVFTLYYDNGHAVKWMTLQGKTGPDGISGKFVLPDSVLAFCVKPKVYRNGKEAYPFPVYKNGQPVKGALIATGQFYYNYRFYTGIEDNPKAIALFQKEFQQHPDLKPKYLLSYYRNGVFGYGVLGAQMEKTWLDSLQKGSDERFLQGLYMIASGSRVVDDEVKGRLKRELLAKYPFGELALEAVLPSAVQKARDGELEEILVLEKKYAPLAAIGKFDEVYSRITPQLFWGKKYAEAHMFLGKIRADEPRIKSYTEASSALIVARAELDSALSYMRKALDLHSGLQMPLYVTNITSWMKDQDYKRAGYLDIYGQVLYLLGKKTEALKQVTEAAKLNIHTISPVEHQLEYLLGSGQPAIALETAGNYVLADRTSDQVRSFLKQAYLETKGAAGYDAYLRGLIRQVDGKYVLPEYSKIKRKSIDFTLADLDGVPVSLTDYRNKTVVLYFFSPNYSSWGRDSINSYIDAQARKSAGKKDIVFLGIDRTPIFENDESRRKALRIAKLKEFVREKGYTFKILLDDFHFEPWNSVNYFRVAADYTSDSTAQFFIIDKDGIVRYKSYPTDRTTPERFVREFTAALKFVKGS
jgi:cytochrome oxidase Cu insertion factor (SCO1/SenC/PrrC family)